MRFRFCIPSYKRSENVRTVEYLYNGGIDKKDIFIFVKNEEEEVLYRKNYGQKANIVCGHDRNIAHARNNILNYFPQMTRIVMLDDDITSIVRKDGKDCKKMSVDEFLSFLEFAFTYVETGNASTFTVYPIANGFFMSDKIDEKNIGLATVMGIVNRNYRFDETYYLKEDYEFCLRQISDGLNCPRFNYISSTALHRIKGGVYDLWGDDDMYAKKLVERYPKLLALAKTKSKIRFKKNGTM